MRVVYEQKELSLYKTAALFVMTNLYGGFKVLDFHLVLTDLVESDKRMEQQISSDVFYWERFQVSWGAQRILADKGTGCAFS